MWHCLHAGSKVPPLGQKDTKALNKTGSLCTSGSQVRGPMGPGHTQGVGRWGPGSWTHPGDKEVRSWVPGTPRGQGGGVLGPHAHPEGRGHGKGYRLWGCLLPAECPWALPSAPAPSPWVGPSEGSCEDSSFMPTYKSPIGPDTTWLAFNKRLLLLLGKKNGTAGNTEQNRYAKQHKSSSKHRKLKLRPHVSQYISD